MGGDVLIKLDEIRRNFSFINKFVFFEIYQRFAGQLFVTLSDQVLFISSLESQTFAFSSRLKS